VPVKARGMNQAHHRCGSLSGTQAAGEQPIIATDGHRPDSILNPIVIDRHSAVIQVMRERIPASQAVIDGFCRRTALRHTLALRKQPGV